MKLLKFIYLLILLLFSSYMFCQGNKSTIKAQIALGVNAPSSDGFVTNFEGKPLNFPIANLGIQYMFSPKLGGKLDYGFNRITNSSNSTSFKLNYSRVNLQLVYDVSSSIFISPKVGIFLHAGPGVSIIKPLGNYTNNNLSFLNTVFGIDWHYGISDNLTVFLDTSYILGFGSEFNPVSSGFGAFNGNVLTFTLGISISLSGCYFCEN